MSDEDAWSEDNSDDAGDDPSEDADDIGSDDDQSCLRMNDNLMKEISNILQSSCEVSCRNALTLNKEMQRQLLDVRRRLHAFLTTLNSRYERNEMRLKDNMKRRRGLTLQGAYIKGGTFYFKGNMFFKDADCRNCPNNKDYEYRRKIEGEIFPMDFELCVRHVWSMMDKVGIVQGVKEQAIDYLSDQAVINSHKQGPNGKHTRALAKKLTLHSENLANLLTQVDDQFRIDWEQISIYNLHHRHSPYSCAAMWNVYLQPSLNRSKWSIEEDQRLLEAAKAHNFQNWPAIASAVGGRSDYQCFIEYETHAYYLLPHRWGRWNKQEDKLLLELVEQNTVNGVVNWNLVATEFPNKSKPSLYARYAYSADPKINHAPFTPEEDLLLLAAVKEFGTKFACFPRTLFPHRALTQLRSRYFNTLQNRHKMQGWSVQDDTKLMEFVNDNGTSSWTKCAQILGNHSRMSCRTRYLTIKGFLDKNPDSSVQDLPRKSFSFKRSVITEENWMDKIAELRSNPNVDLKPKKNYQRSKSSKREEPNVQKEDTPKRKTKKQLRDERRAEKEMKKLNASLVDNSGIKPVYVERLRPNDKRVYDALKYTYKFKVQEHPCKKVPTTNDSLSMVANALRFDLPVTKLAGSIFNAEAETVHNKLLQLQPSSEKLPPLGHNLPPSYSSAVAFRALCIMAGKSNGKERAPLPDEVEKNENIQKFRQRFRALFNDVAVLSRVMPSSVPNIETRISAITSSSEFQQQIQQQQKLQAIYKLAPENAEGAGIKDESESQTEKDNLDIVSEGGTDVRPTEMLQQKPFLICASNNHTDAGIKQVALAQLSELVNSKRGRRNIDAKAKPSKKRARAKPAAVDTLLHDSPQSKKER